MALEIEVCPHGIARLNFYAVRDTVVAQGDAFDRDVLICIPYEQLGLAATSAAGSAVCSVEEAAAAQKSRRRRFVNMPPDLLAACTRYLRVEGMYHDVLAEIQQRSSPTWSLLNPRQQVWCKLTCIYNHVDHPLDRLLEVVMLFHECAATGSLPKEVAISFRQKVQELRSDREHGLKDSILRREIGGMADCVLDFLPDSEQDLVAKELLQDYQCTSDCFRGLRNLHA